MDFFEGELVWATDGTHAEYANIESICPDGALNIRWRKNTKISQPAKINHVPLAYMVFSDLRYIHMPDALLKGHIGKCYHHSLNNGWNIKIIIDGDAWKVAKESSPGVLDSWHNVRTIGDIQKMISQWHNAKYVIDANMIFQNWPVWTVEFELVNRYSLMITSTNVQERAAGYNAFSDLLTRTRFFKDICHYWIGVYHYNNYSITKGKTDLQKARFHYAESDRISGSASLSSEIANIDLHISKCK